jgi:predicted TIM-barrel fold metal-dependent hydrolase
MTESPSLAARTRIIDCCVHHHWRSQAELTDYMSAGWRDYVGVSGVMPEGVGVVPLIPQPNVSYYSHPFGDKLRDAYPADGPPGSDYGLLKEQLLDRFGLERALLAHDGAVIVGGLPNPHFATEIARAVNDWTIDRWLRQDARFAGAAVVATQLPEEAARELRRVGSDDQIVAVLLAANALGKPFGYPVFDPIYRAAEELGLVVLLRAGGNATPDQVGHTAAGGLPATYAEFDALASQTVMTHIVTMITQGVFEKYPALRVLVAGAGVTWITQLLMRFDTDYKGLRREAPWMTRMPSDYFREHVRVATCPLESIPTSDKLHSYLEAFGGLEDVLCYASGYPNAHFDNPGMVADRLPPAWSSAVLSGNAARLFGWSQAPQPPVTSLLVGEGHHV